MQVSFDKALYPVLDIFDKLYDDDNFIQAVVFNSPVLLRGYRSTSGKAVNTASDIKVTRRVLNVVKRSYLFDHDGNSFLKHVVRHCVTDGDGWSVEGSARDYFQSVTSGLLAKIKADENKYKESIAGLKNAYLQYSDFMRCREGELSGDHKFMIRMYRERHDGKGVDIPPDLFEYLETEIARDMGPGYKKTPDGDIVDYEYRYNSYVENYVNKAEQDEYTMMHLMALVRDDVYTRVVRSGIVDKSGKMTEKLRMLITRFASTWSPKFDYEYVYRGESDVEHGRGMFSRVVNATGLFGSIKDQESRNLAAVGVTTGLVGLAASVASVVRSRRSRGVTGRYGVRPRPGGVSRRSAHARRPMRSNTVRGA